MPDILLTFSLICATCCRRASSAAFASSPTPAASTRWAAARPSRHLRATSALRDRVKVALVLGDDLYPDIDALLASGEPLANMDTGQALSEIRARVLSANAYIGAAGIVKALERGANVIITGRVADAAVTLAPMMHEFGWSATDWDRLAAGIVAGHIIECGTQCTGGNFTDWPLVKTYRRIGFPARRSRRGRQFRRDEASEHRRARQRAHGGGADPV